MNKHIVVLITLTLATSFARAEKGLVGLFQAVQAGAHSIVNDIKKPVVIVPATQERGLAPKLPVKHEENWEKQTKEKRKVSGPNVVQSCYLSTDGPRFLDQREVKLENACSLGGTTYDLPVTADFMAKLAEEKLFMHQKYCYNSSTLTEEEGETSYKKELESILKSACIAAISKEVGVQNADPATPTPSTILDDVRVNTQVKINAVAKLIELTNGQIECKAVEVKQIIQK